MAKEKETPDQTDPAAAFRVAAERSVDQARKAFDDALGLAHKTIAGMETNSAQIQGHVRDITRDTLDYAGATAEATFELIERLSKSKSAEEAVAIQKAFVEAQMERLGRQARSFGDGAIKAAQDLTKPFER